MYRLLNLIIIFGLFSCSGRVPENNLDILAKVGDRIITKQDFIRRAEYSIRPLYCRQANYIHKKIILNSLIAEKLLALEAEKAKVDLLDNPLFQSFVLGRSEQAMRQLHYYDEFYKQVELDSAAVLNAYKLAGRTVDITFINLPDLNSANTIKNLVMEGISLDSAYTMIWGQHTPPKRQLNWFDKESVDLHKAIFNPDVTKGSIIGPLVPDNKTFLLLQVNGWTDRPAITESEKSLRITDVRKRLRENDAEQKYKEWVHNIMTGKQLELNPNVFPAYAEKVTDIYLQSDSVKQAQYGKFLWDDPELDFIRDSLTSAPLESFVETDIFFHVDNVSWTIQEFHQEIRKHPLVFRKKKMNRGEFQEQLKFAIADLVRNIEITKDCYENKYEQSSTVKLNRELWYDSSIARYYRSILFKEMGVLYDDPENVAIRMNPIVDSLQTTYSDQIEIDTDLFESIELTSIDMTVIQHGVPFPKVVPPFPVFTNDNKLDYGHRKEF
ncbi:MAG TPA: hypothetical protein QGF08_04590 [Candidatus Marinimicrobia bacterium]|nr:hypothetical protein [Candidatus Neomarinimicrobiota bacterium]MDP7437091.1 hypothetical protein [Candidatus Neomarinimicrobiota bacterium]HJL75252.1 hypothetical protein [Candidatus Neomarinimicrobiota bacterium]HJM70142.1 hypothetical protein [Candidatus Neomarinimicrobiota bacterium]